jgi:hypothetical protein
MIKGRRSQHEEDSQKQKENYQRQEQATERGEKLKNILWPLLEPFVKLLILTIIFYYTELAWF